MKELYHTSLENEKGRPSQDELLRIKEVNLFKSKLKRNYKS